MISVITHALVSYGVCTGCIFSYRQLVSTLSTITKVTDSESISSEIRLPK